MSNIGRCLKDLKTSNENLLKQSAKIRDELDEIRQNLVAMKEQLEEQSKTLKKDREVLDRMEETLARRKQFCGIGIFPDHKSTELSTGL